ncbi:hypothetical protein FQR65_LT02908 [Abscondita terminalis]|nr:hypothetical protein FQR65_LT02908 [Abscondita terminalis]
MAQKNICAGATSLGVHSLNDSDIYHRPDEPLKDYTLLESKNYTCTPQSAPSRKCKHASRENRENEEKILLTQSRNLENPSTNVTDDKEPTFSNERFTNVSIETHRITPPSSSPPNILSTYFTREASPRTPPDESFIDTTESTQSNQPSTNFSSEAYPTTPADACLKNTTEGLELTLPDECSMDASPTTPLNECFTNATESPEPTIPDECSTNSTIATFPTTPPDECSTDTTDGPESTLPEETSSKYTETVPTSSTECPESTKLLVQKLLKLCHNHPKNKLRYKCTEKHLSFILYYIKRCKHLN